MREVVFEKKSVNPSKLHEELEAALGEGFVGVSQRACALVVHLADDSQVKETDLVTLVEAHDPTKLTAAQQFHTSQAARLEALRGKAWADWTDGDKDDLLMYVAGQIGLLDAS